MLWLSSPFVVHVEPIPERTSCSKLLPRVRITKLNFHSRLNSLHLLSPFQHSCLFCVNHYACLQYLAFLFITETQHWLAWRLICRRNPYILYPWLSQCDVLFTGGRIRDRQLYKAHPNRWSRHHILHSAAAAWARGRHSTGAVAGDSEGHQGTLLFISQLPKLCVKISILMHRRMWVHSFSTRLTSVTFAEDKVLIFLILRKNAQVLYSLAYLWGAVVGYINWRKIISEPHALNTAALHRLYSLARYQPILLLLSDVSLLFSCLCYSLCCCLPTKEWPGWVDLGGKLHRGLLACRHFTIQ